MHTPISFIISMSIGTALVPLIGQNWGAGKFDRINQIRSLLNKTALIYGLILFLLMLPLAGLVARIFSSDVEVINRIRWYLWILIIGSTGLNLYTWASEELNAAGKPKWVLIINVLGTCIILIPFTILGAAVAGYRGLLAGLCIGQLLLGAIAVIVGKRQLNV